MHRIPAPPPAFRGGMLIAAVAAGAVAAAAHTTGGGTADAAGDAQQGKTLLFDATAGDGPLAAVTGPQGPVEQVAGPGGPVEQIAGPAGLDQVTGPAGPLEQLTRAIEEAAPESARPLLHEVLAVTRDTESDDQLNALARISDSGLSEPPFQLGVPYAAGNDENLDGWIAKALGLMGLPQSIAPGLKKIIMHESTGNPRAINLWDSNASRGTPSQGLMQTIPSVYNACVLPSLADRPITDPVANITAGVRAMIANHGLETLVAGGRKSASGGYLGYGGSASCNFEMSELDSASLSTAD